MPCAVLRDPLQQVAKQHLAIVLAGVDHKLRRQRGFIRAVDTGENNAGSF